MNNNWFFIGSIVGLFAGIAIGKIMFDSGDNLPTTKKWSCQNKIKDLEKENKILTNQIDLLIKDTIR